MESSPSKVIRKSQSALFHAHFIVPMWAILLFCILTSSPVIAGCNRDLSSHDTFDPSVIKNEDFYEAMRLEDEYRYDDAELKYLSALEEISGSLGSGSPEAAYVEMEIGSFYANLGRYDDAIDHLVSSYTAFKHHFGADDHNTTLALINLSECDILLGDYAQALASLKDALPTLQDKEEIFVVSGKIAHIYCESEDYETARKWYESLLTQLPDDDFSTKTVAEFYNSYGVFLSAVKDEGGAIEAFKRSLELSVNERPEDTIPLRLNLYDALSRSGRRSEAVSYLSETLDIVEGISSDYDRAHCYTALSKELLEVGEDELFKEFSLAALELLRDTVGINSEPAVVLLSHIGSYRYEHQSYDMAIYYYERAITIQKNILKMQSSTTAALYEDIACAYYELEDYEQCLNYAEECRIMNLELFGEDAFPAADAYGIKAAAYLRLQQRRNACECIDTALDLYSKHIASGSRKNGGYAKTYALAGSIYGSRPDDMTPSEYAATKDYDFALSCYAEAETVFIDLYGLGNWSVAENGWCCADTFLAAGDVNNASEVYKETLRQFLAYNGDQGHKYEDYPQYFSDRLMPLYEAINPELTYEEWFFEWYEGG